MSQTVHSKPTVYVLGDSHTRYLLGGQVKPDEELVVDHGSFVARGMQLGGTGATAWGLPNLDSITQAGVKAKQYLSGKFDFNVYVSFGEVDVRNHVQKHGNILRTTKKVVDRYVGWIEDNLANRKHLFVAGVIPYTKKFFSVNHRSRDHLHYAPALFNALLFERIESSFDHYVDLYEGLTDREGFLLDEFAGDPGENDEIHLKPTPAAKHIVPQIERYLPGCGPKPV